MSEKNENKKELVKLDGMNIGNEEIINVFISKWEDSLYEKKKDLNKVVNDLKKKVKDWIEKIEGEGKEVGKKLERKIEDINVSVKYGSIGIDYDKEIINVNMVIKEDGGERYHGSLNITKKVEIGKEKIKEYKKLNEEIEVNRKKLEEVMGEIRNISRKERKIKGIISEKKLVEEGFDELLNDEDIKKVLMLEG